MTFYSIFRPTGEHPASGNQANEAEDDATVVAGENRGFVSRETREICLKWVYPMSNAKRKIMQSHHTILTMMLKAHPDLVVIDNKGQEHSDKKSMQPTERNRPFEFYMDNRNRSRKSLVCIHRLRTQKSMAELKDSWGVMDELKKFKAYVRIHAFGERDREISHLGFIPGVNMVNTIKEVVKEEITTMLKQECLEVPNFEIVQVGVDIGKQSKAGERTRAYEIQCLQRDASKLAKMLQSGIFKNNPVYIPYSMKKSNPSVFKGAIKRQIKVLSEQWVVKLQGLTATMIEHIKEAMSEQPIQAIVPTRVTEKGEWKILVNRNAFKTTIEWLQANWNNMLEAMPDTLHMENPFDRPRIITRNGAHLDQESEEGTIDTYGTILSSLYCDVNECEEVHSEVSDNETAPTGQNSSKPVSYAQVTRGTTSTTVSQVSGWTEQRNDELAKLQEEHTSLQEKHTSLEDKFNSVTAEMAELKNLLKSLLAQNQKQAEDGPPSKRQATSTRHNERNVGLNNAKRKKRIWSTNRLKTILRLDNPSISEMSETIGVCALRPTVEADWAETESEGEEEEMDRPTQEVGDTLEGEKDEGTLRVYFQNINGIKWDQDGGAWPAVCQAMREIEVDIMGFVETNVDTSQFKVRRQIEQIANKFFNHKRILCGTSNRQVRRTYKPGGTLMMSVGKSVSLIRETTRDRMGRWVSFRYQGQNNTRVTMIAAYQVCQTRRGGKHTAATQQINMIIEEAAAEGQLTRVNPRQAFIRDLKSFIQHRQSEGDKIILVGDFNETITEQNGGMAHLAGECALVDACSHRLGTSESPSTYKRSNRRLDYILVSREILPSIKKLGYEPFDYRGITSDHRGLFMDIAAIDLFGNQPIPLAPPTRREFTTDRPEKIVQYVEAKYKELVNHNIHRRLEYMESMEVPDHEYAERFDRDITRASLKATKEAKDKHKHPWSPALARAWATIHLYQTVRSQIRNPQIDNWASIRKWQTKYEHMPKELPTTIQEVERRLKEAREALKEIRRKADEHRKAHLDERANMYAALDAQGKARIVRRIKRAEDLARSYRKLRYIRQEANTHGLDEIQVPTDSSMDPKQCPPDPALWRTVRVPTEITELLIERNRKHFGQAHGTPLTHQEFVSQVHYDGTGAAAELILQGNYTPESLDEASKLFMKHLSRKTIEELPGTLTKEDFLGKLKHWPESTTTSPSGLHLGHYHALWKKSTIHPQTEGQVYQRFEQKRDILLRAHLAIINYALKFGYSFQRWHKVVNIMLRKDEKNSFIHRLRVIHLYEADYNLLLAVKWRQVMHNAEDKGFLNEGLYGSRPGRSAHDPVFIELMQNEIYRASMKSGVIKDLDATSCYDRILAWLASICSRRLGINKMVAAVNSRTLESAKYHLKTSTGVSDNFYQHCEAYPIYGTGQGSGNSPHLWCFVASTLFDAFESEAHGASFYSYDGTKSLKVFMIGFVDDCSQRVNNFKAYPQPNAAELVELMERDAQLWNDLLWSSGGALEIPKCSFQVVETDWSLRGRPFLNGICNAPPLRIASQNNQIIQVKQISNYKARRVLGVHISPSGMMTTQYGVLLGKSKKYAEAVLTNALSRREAKIMYLGIYIPSITYPLALTCLTAGQCRSIETPMMRAIIPRCGYNRSMSYHVRVAPIKYGGAGFMSLHVEQTLNNFLTVMKHLRSQEMQPGQMAFIAITWAQAHAGVSWPLWEQPDRAIPKIPTPWIEGIRNNLASLNAKMVVAGETVPPKLRSQDWHIMDVALELGRFNRSEIEDINACRRYLQAITAADLSNDRGTKLREAVWYVNETPNPANHICELFNQGRPNLQACRTWRKFLKCVTTQDQYLRVPLGPWVVTYVKCRRRPQWVYDVANRQLYYRAEGREHYTRCPRNGRRYTKPNEEDQATEAPPTSSYPVQVIDLGHVVDIQHNYDSQLPITPEFNTFQQFIQSLEP